MLPRPYVRVMSSPTAELELAATAHRNLRSFPGHTDASDRLFQIFLQNRARLSDEPAEISEIEQLARGAPVSDAFANNLVAEFWDRRVAAALRQENRDEAFRPSADCIVNRGNPVPQMLRRSKRTLANSLPMDIRD